MKYEIFKEIMRKAHVLARKLLSFNRPYEEVKESVNKYFNDNGVRPLDTDIETLVDRVQDKLDIDLDWQAEINRLDMLGLLE